MKDDNAVQIKSYAFAVRIVKLYQHHSNEKRERVLSRQLLRSGTSVGANVEEAIGAQSRPDFVGKLSIAYKESREAMYWLRLMKDTGYLNDMEFDSIATDATELQRILVAILRSTKAYKEPRKSRSKARARTNY